jgi:hypothetical protein
MGDRYLRDVHDLRAGERWSERLEGLIREADVFQLFWSWNAMRSDYVEQEWRYALGLRRPHFVRPTYWEVPLPAAPDREMPPEELSRLHFQLLTMGTGSHPPAPPKPSLDDTVVAMSPPVVVAAPPAPLAPSPPPSLEETRPAFPAPDLAAPPPVRPSAAPRPSASNGSWAAPGSAPPRRSSPGALVVYLLGAVAAGLIALLFVMRGCGLVGSSTAESTELIHLSRPPGAEPSAGSASADSKLPAPPPNWKSWRDGARACGLAFSDLERIARSARSAGQPAVEVLPADGERQPGLRQRLADGGEKAFIMPVTGEGKAACAVWIGPLGSTGEAEEVARRVSSTYGVEARPGGLPDIDALGRSQPAP